MTTAVLPSPHTHGARPVSQTMLLVMLALLPATLSSFWHFGWPAVYLWLVTIVACVLAETLAVLLARRPLRPTLADGSAILTGWLLALSLPPWAPWWIAAVGGVFAIIVVKQIFGGLGQNVFNPAMAARVVLLISFPLEMTRWIIPPSLGSGPGPVEALAITFGSPSLADGISGATVLDPAGGGFDVFTYSLGHHAGSMGETSALLLAAGGVFLIVRGVIGLRIPSAFLLGVAVPAALAYTLVPDSQPSPLFHLLSGGVMLGAFFIATDYVTSPSTPLGQWIFGLGCGLLTWIIRTWGAYPEGVAFAILLMNAATPLIDHYTRPRIFGRRRDGHSLASEER